MSLFFSIEGMKTLHICGLKYFLSKIWMNYGMWGCAIIRCVTNLASLQIRKKKPCNHKRKASTTTLRSRMKKRRWTAAASRYPTQSSDDSSLFSVAPFLLCITPLMRLLATNSPLASAPPPFLTPDRPSLGRYLSITYFLNAQFDKKLCSSQRLAACVCVCLSVCVVLPGVLSFSSICVVRRPFPCFIFALKEFVFVN
jgi:hypothetical protein